MVLPGYLRDKKLATRVHRKVAEGAKVGVLFYPTVRGSRIKGQPLCELRVSVVIILFWTGMIEPTCPGSPEPSVPSS